MEQSQLPHQSKESDSFSTDNKNSNEDVEKGQVKVTVTITTNEHPGPDTPNRRRRWRTAWEKATRQLSTSAVGKKRAWCMRITAVVSALSLLAAIAVLVWTFMVIALINRLTPTIPRNGLATILSQWKEPTSNVEAQTSWLPNFSSGVTPKPIHSHNDYSRDIPLFRALSVGCIGVEADIHLVDDDLLVAHTAQSLRPARTLSSLYLNPLVSIIQSQNRQSDRVNNSAPLIGVFNDRPQESLILLLDFKTPAEQTLPTVMKQLAPLQDAGYLTQWNGTHLVEGVLTIVGSGLMSTRLDLLNQTNGLVFLDAPLLHLSDANATYDTTNSFYASAQLAPALGGRVGLWGMSKRQRTRVDALVKEAQAKGLRARFWDTPSWPISLRDKVWRQLVESGVAMLNADDVQAAALWNWNWCNVAGIRLC